MFPTILATALLTSTVFLQEYAAQPAVCERGEVTTSDVGTDEYLYPGTNTEFFDTARYAVSTESVSFTLLDRKLNQITAYVKAAEGGYVEMPLFYYPGYVAKINGEARMIQRGENNVVRVLLLPGDSGELRVHYRGKILWRCAEWVSLLSVLGYAGYQSFGKRKRIGLWRRKENGR